MNATEAAETAEFAKTAEAYETANPSATETPVPFANPDSTGACAWPGYSAYVIQTGLRTSQRVCVYLSADPYINGYRPWVTPPREGASCPTNYEEASLAIASATAPQVLCLHVPF